MALDNAANFVQVIVSTGYNSAATSIVLASGTTPVLPTAPFNMVWWDQTDYPNPTNDPNVEVVRVTSATTVSSTRTLTVTRAQESTTATNKNTAGKTYAMLAGLTAKVINTDIPANYTAYNSTMTTSGGVPYVTGSGSITADAGNFSWVDANNSLNIGTSSSTFNLAVVNTASGSDVTGIFVRAGTANPRGMYITSTCAGLAGPGITWAFGAPGTATNQWSCEMGTGGALTFGYGSSTSTFTGYFQMRQGLPPAIFNSLNIFGQGWPLILGSSTLTAQSTNVGTTTILASTPGAGLYRFSAVISLTTPAQSSCVVPSVQVVYTSQDAAISATNTVITTAVGNTTADISQASFVFAASAASTVKFFTTGYASVGTATMSYSLRSMLEYLG